MPDYSGGDDASQPEDTSGELTEDQVKAAFTGKVAPAPVGLLYRLGMIVVLVTMIILPLVYFALIGAAGWGVYLWATKGTFLLSGGGGRVMLFKLVLYLTPLFSGIVVVLFMIKPLLARRMPPPHPLALSPEAAPALYQLIERICAVVGAPRPSRVNVDCQLNASASFRRGMRSFVGSDLVLTIGMPLVAGLSAKQLAGVIAHEFGHFTQGFGMRLTYIIRSINAWFARIAYERDAWD
ncbi:MAG: M48 family metallopeptidase, partial [Verrucomicrobiota bacterium]